ncbi:hypothetical protein JH06_3276 [Blastocystis sp. subtype 4]|uniref:hypothetical protein n=1 Tax=Blastocystis sp. subtype 4 TaxID=944170 RepID=UPI000711DB1C|nr:hypothetical protein JH06_3276 [Blastocystis sp. subtype 4]KNB42943.1 hypothetical protein JH06_3276 [Blastocystis sp. subtype 4]|eukprot:XP_014526386.1 hypothetical protein JH06_3276 [Blastocystis sp. subtype 4]
MQTQLAAQLKSIRVANADVVDYSSILFSPKEAAKMSIQAVYSLGRNGIMELIRIDSRFQRFDETLFGNRLLSTNRENVTDAENKEIDEMVQDYLFSVAPYMLLRCVQKSLEYLIRRLSIHTFNAEDFFLAVLPYHESPLFARVFKILRLDKSIFLFLESAKKVETPIIRGTLSTQCIKDQAFLDFILNGIRRLNMAGMLPVAHLTLVCAIVVDIVRLGALKEQVVRSLIGFASVGFSSTNSEFQATSLLILAQIAINVTLSEDIITACLNSLLRTDHCNLQRLVECLLLLFRSNATYTMPVATAQQFFQNPTLPSSLQSLSQKASLLPILSAVAPALNTLLLEDSTYLETLSVFAQLIRPDEAHTYMKLCLDSLNQVLSTLTLTSSQQERVEKLLLTLSSQYSEVFDAYVSELPQETPLKPITQSLFYGSSHMVLSNGRTLFLNIENRTYVVRKEVCDLLIQQIVSCSNETPLNQREFLKNSIASLLEDDYLDLSLRILSVPLEQLLHVFDNTSLVSVLFNELGHTKLIEGNAEKVVAVVFRLLSQLDIIPVVQNETPETLITTLCILYSYLLHNESAEYLKDCLAVLCMIPHPFAQIGSIKGKKINHKSLWEILAKRLADKENQSVMVLQSLQMALKSPVSSFFVHVGVALLQTLPQSSFQSEVACCLCAHAMSVLEEMPGEEVAKLKLSLNELSSLSWKAFDAMPLMLSPLETVRFMLSLLVVCATNLSWETQALLPNYSQYQSLSAHPLTIICYCFTRFSPQQSCYMIVANYVASTVWTQDPSLPFSTLLLCSNESNILLHALNKMLNYISAQNSLSYGAFSSCLLAVLIHLQSPVLSVRSTALLLLDALCLKGGKKPRRNSRENGMIGEKDSGKEAILIQLIQFILGFRGEIRDDAKMFPIKFGLLFAENSSVPRDSLSTILLPLILGMEPEGMRVKYLRLCQRIPYTESSEEAVLQRCVVEYQKMDMTQECSIEGKEEWALLVPWFFRAMSQTLIHQQEFRSALFSFMQKDLMVNTPTGPFAPLSVVLEDITNDVFRAMNAPERQSLFHAMLCVASRIHSVDAVQVYESVNHLDLSVMLLMEEAQSLVHDGESEFDQIQLMTGFIEVVTRNPKFQQDIQVIDPLLVILTRLVTIVKAHTIPRDTLKEETQRATAGEMEIESVNETNVALSDTLALFYPIQILLECLYSILSASTNPVRVITSQQTLQTANSQPPTKRARRNSVSIHTDIMIQPQLLVDLINLNLTTQINKTCLQLLSVLASMHSDTINEHLFICFDDLATRVIVNQDEEAFAVIISVLTHCLRRFNDEKQILRVYKTFLSCVPYLPYSQSIQLLNTFIAHSSINYIGHSIAYLLLLNNAISIGKEMEIPSSRVQNSELAASGIYRFVTSVFMGVNLIPQIQALGVLVSFAEYLMDLTHENKREMNRIEALTQALVGSLPLEEWRQKETTILTIDQVVVHFVRDIVSHPTFIGKVTSAERDSDKIQKYFVHIIESLLILLQNCSVNKERIGEQSRGRKRTEEELEVLSGLKTVEGVVYDCVTVFSEVLTVPTLITIISVLIRNGDGTVRKRALVMLNTKIHESEESLSNDDIQAYLGFVQNLVGLCDNPSELAVTRQTALLSIHILTQFFASEYPDVFLPAVQSVITIISQATSSASGIQALKGSAYIALSMLCSKLGIRILPFLPKFAPALLKELDQGLKRLEGLNEEMKLLEGEESGDAITERQSQREEILMLLQSLLSSLAAVVQNQSGLLSVYLHQMLVLLLSPTLLMIDKPVLKNSVQALYELISEQIETRLILPAVIDTYKSLPPHSPSSVCQLFILLKLVVDRIPEDKIETYAVKIWTFCVQGLEARSKWSAEEVDEESITKVETAVVGAMISITLKLSEAQLTPLFIQTVAWMEEKATVSEQSELPPVAKAIPFYALVTELASKLKSIFTPFFGHFFSIGIGFLEAFSKTCKREKPAEEQASQQDLFHVTKLVVLSLYRCFLYDSEGWLDEEKVSSVSTPLVRLIGSYFVPDYVTEYGKFMQSYVVPTVVQLVVSTSGHDDWWQSLNHQVLLQTRSPINAVKLVAIRVIRECFDRMAQEYLPLLPDVIPFLADLLEDEDAEVEKMAQELRHQLESLSGEELTSYLTM